MNPAFSVIIFTALSGAGYGLLTLLAIFAAIEYLPENSSIGRYGVAFSVLLITTGLLSSMVHLGHPERAWRALTQWRSSWLSREGLFAILTYIPAIFFFIGWGFSSYLDIAWKSWGVLAALLAMITVFCTGKIYSSLKTIRQWNNFYVVPGYLLIGLLGGSILLSFITAIFGVFTEEFGWTVLFLSITVGMLKTNYWRLIDTTTSQSTMQSATGLGDGKKKIHMLDAPTTSENYIMRVMAFIIARKHTIKLRHIALLTLFIIPAITALSMTLIHSAFAIIILAIIGVIAGGIGTIVERWLFFAEAKHVVTLYYGNQSV